MNGRGLLLLAALAAGLCAPRAAAAASRTETSFQSVVVAPGDTLWSISHKYLKDPSRWDEILKYNRLPSADPTVALPGMVLKVPVRLIKSSLRAAYLVYMVNRVLYRRKDTADWRSSKGGMQLYQGDFLRTLDDSRARVKFLNKELLNLEPNSMAVIKPVDSDADVVLRRGSVFAGRAVVITAAARVTPRTRDTRYSASVEPDLTTKVEVYKGQAAVDAQGSRVVVPAGMQTLVPRGLAPQVPRPLDNPASLEARAQEFDSARAVGGGAAPHPTAESGPAVPEADASSVRGDLASLRVGVPIMGYHIQAARDRAFTKIVFDRHYDSDERFSPSDARLPKGAYWWRVALIDLLGAEDPYSAPRYYTLGVAPPRLRAADLSAQIAVYAPAEGTVTCDGHVRVVGMVRDDRLTVTVAGNPARADADGNFVSTVHLAMGLNEIEIVVADGRGDSTRLVRRVTRR